MNKFNLIVLALFAAFIMASCGGRKDRCPTVHKNTPSEVQKVA